MRAQSWYQQTSVNQHKGEKNMQHDCCDGRCTYACEMKGGVAMQHPPKVSLPCVSFVPARAAYHEIKVGALLIPDGNNRGVYIREIENKRVSIGVGHVLETSSPCGYWDKEGLRRFGEALLKLSEYMEG